ncbi:MAG: serine/threonine protein kinase [Chloroflexota bacterium]
MSFIPGANVGPYRIVEQAERNGVATTYTAYQPSQGRYVSVVVVPTIERDDVALQRQYQRQIELILSLRHPNILTVLDHGEHLDVPFIVTELVEAEPLSDRLGAPWPLAEVVRILRPIALALDFAHGYGVVHGDVRPSQVLLTPDGTPILAGFGLSTRRFSEAAGAPTPSPEPGRRTPSVTAEIARAQLADRRGLALITYEMLTGRTVDVDAADFERPLPPAQLGSPLLTPSVERALLRELTGEPKDQYSDATAFIDDLATPLAAPRPPSDSPPPPPLSATPSPNGASRRQLVTVAVILTALAVLGSLALLLRGGEPARPVGTTGRPTTADPSPMGTVIPGGAATGSPVAGASPNPGNSGQVASGTRAPGSASQGAGTSTAGGPAAAGLSTPSPDTGGAATQGSGAPPASMEATVARPAATIGLLVPTPDVVTPALPTPLPTRVGSATGPAAGGPSTAATPSSGGPSASAATSGPSASGPAPKPAPISTRIPVTWRVVGDPSGRWIYDDQGRVAGRTDEGASLVLFPETVEDVTYSALVNTTSCQATLVFRAQDDENLLMAIYIPDGIPAPGTAGGGIWLYQRVEGLDIPIKTVRPSTVKPAGQPVRVKILTSGPQITVSLDDEPALQAVDTAPRAGKLGLMVYSANGRQCEATFDDIQR